MIMSKFAEHVHRKRLLVLACFGVCVCVFMLSNLAVAQNPSPTPSVTPAPTKTPSPNVGLKESLEKSLAAEQEKMKQLEEQLKQVQRFEKGFEAEFNAYKIQISAYNSLLLVPEALIEELENVRGNTHTVLENITVRLEEFSQERNTLDQLRLKTEEQHAFNQKQLDEIKTDSSKKAASDPETKELLEKMQTLTDLFSEERKILENIQIVYTALITRLEEIQHDFAALLEKFALQIEERKKQELFKRKANPFALLGKDQVYAELAQLADRVQLIVSIAFWIETFRTLWNTEGFILIRFILFLAIALFLLLRFRRFFANQVEKIPCDQFPWRCLILQLLERSLPLFGATVLLYLYAQMRLFSSSVTLVQVLTHLSMVFLFSHWTLHFLTLWKKNRGDSHPAQLVSLIRVLVIAARYFAISYIIIEWALGTASVILLLARMLFELGVFIWGLVFGEQFRKTPEHIFPGQPQTRQTCRSLTIGLVYIIVSGGLLLELAGYGQLARYWYVSWAQTMIVLLGSLLVFFVLQEWEKGIQDIAVIDKDKLEQTAHQLRWLTARLSWLAWPALTIIGLLFAWGAKQVVLVSALEALTYPVPIGGLNLHLLGIIYAILILLFTHVATRLWRRALKEKILVNSGLEIGVQVSITTISVYLLWLFGILWALNSLGVGTTSLAVAFGALGIGLGFGLQSIFNNFMSGLILLFERPIEPGDVLEINGKWGFVEKINVRSTVVRTYENSALIIPNSDIISNQLTNWTFKDVRVRRTITIGVAYGSDARLVEQILYGIAEKHPRVHKEPAPTVLFSDFGADALIFTLRLWTLLDYGLSTETDIRFEIDRIFQEKNIEIPFPQRDIHIRSGLESLLPERKAEEPETTQEQKNVE